LPLKLPGFLPYFGGGGGVDLGLGAMPMMLCPLLNDNAFFRLGMGFIRKVDLHFSAMNQTSMPYFF
jgi:hypothetical protein